MSFANAEMTESRVEVGLDVIGRDSTLVQHYLRESNILCTLKLVGDIVAQAVPVDPIAHRWCVDYVKPIAFVAEISFEYIQRESSLGKDEEC
jgi:hypothetical protein